MIEETKRLIAAGVKIITEATFSYNGNFCIVDILRKAENSYEIIEVKSSAGSEDNQEDDINPVYYSDMSYQYYVVTNSGLDIIKVSLMQLNRDYYRMRDLDIHQLFTVTDCTKAVLALQNDIADNIDYIKAIATQKNEPDETIGSRCDNPYECGYKGWCFRNLPKNNIFEIGWSMWGSRKDAAYSAGIITFKDCLNGDVRLTEKQIRQVITEVRDAPPHINKSALREFLTTVKYPLYYLDFETYQQPIPLWDHVSPYMQIPFQYSLHIQNDRDSLLFHKEFLGKEGIDPRRELAERLCSDIPENVCVIAYNMGFEKSQIKRLAGLFPDLSGHLMSIHDNMIDLIVPFRSGMYYCRGMGGGYSIKNVLPALCGDDTELDYKKLGLVQHGGDAMNAYATLHEQPPEEIEKIRAALLAYCKLDTLAMVKILEKLYEAAEA